MSNRDTSYFTSGRRDSSRRSDSQQLPPLRSQLPEFFPGRELPGARPSRNVPYNCPSQPGHYPPSQDSTPSPYTHSRRTPQPESLHGSRPLPEETPAMHRFAVFSQEMVPQRESDHPSAPSRSARAPSGDTTRRYRCGVCDERFDRPSGLEIHMRSHTLEKPYPCRHPGCSKSFSVKSNLRRHERTHTADSAFEPVDDGHSYSGHYSSTSKPSKPPSSTYYTSSQ